MTASPHGGNPAPAPPRRSGATRGGMAVIGCVGCGALVIILAAVIGIVLFVLNRDEISPRATETFETDSFSFEAPANWTEFESEEEDAAFEWLYNSQAPSGGEKIIVGQTNDPVPPEVVCETLKESSATQQGAEVSDGPSATFDGVESVAFTSIIQSDVGTVAAEYHCLADGDTTVIVVFLDAKSPARTEFGDDLIDSWTWT